MPAVKKILIFASAQVFQLVVAGSARSVSVAPFKTTRAVLVDGALPISPAGSAHRML